MRDGGGKVTGLSTEGDNPSGGGRDDGGGASLPVGRPGRWGRANRAEQRKSPRYPGLFLLLGLGLKGAQVLVELLHPAVGVGEVQAARSRS